MKYKEKIFKVLEKDEAMPAHLRGARSFTDPFDFYRYPVDINQYIPMSQEGLLKAFLEGMVGIHLFIQMATSLRPLADQARDIDEITRLFSQQKLSSRPNPHSVKLLREMIKDPNPEIALYAAEGINSIEGSFNQKIDRVKDRIEGGEGEPFDNYYALGDLYYQYAQLMVGQKLIQDFYLTESLVYLIRAHKINRSDLSVINILAEVLMVLGKFNYAINLYTYLIVKRKDNIHPLIKLAECYYSIGDYVKVKQICDEIARGSGAYSDFSEDFQGVVYQWIL